MGGVILWAEHQRREQRRLWLLFLAAVAEGAGRRTPYLLYAPVVIDPRKAFRITGLGI